VPGASEPESFWQTDAARERFATLDRDRVPAHVAIIMDGNGRWASRRRMPRIAGHRAGARAVREAIASAIELGVRYLTLYSFSSENWSRPDDEVAKLMSLFVEVLESELDNLHEHGVRVRVIGRMEGLPVGTREAFYRAERDTAGNDRLDLIVALNYGGRLELTDAAIEIARRIADGQLEPSDIDEDVFASALYTAGIPDPELVVRTSGEMRVSNFLLWQIAYSELYVTDVLWPDFDREDFLEALLDYQGRERRFGGA
jgi:undecaprenyl diphosphate synthase